MNQNDASPRVWVEVPEREKRYVIMMEHICTDGRVLKYTLPRAVWHVISFEPLTISPSLNCGFCGLKGKFTDGVFVSA